MARWCWVALFSLVHAVLVAQSLSLAERLGYGPQDKLLIINADDAGMTHAENMATLEAMRHGLVGSATLMSPCPWFPEIARAARAEPLLDFGVHLTITSEWEAMRWGPILGRAAVPSLVDAQGYFLGSVGALQAKAKPKEVEAECRAQIQKVLDAGIDISHIDMHMHALGQDIRLFEVYLKLARDFDLPVRFHPIREDTREPQRARLAEKGILTADRLYPGALQPGETVSDAWRRVIRGLKQGVNELYIHVAHEHPEMQALTGSDPIRTGWRDRMEEFRFFTVEPETRRLLEIEGVKLIRWRDLRNLQRKERGGE